MTAPRLRHEQTRLFKGRRTTHIISSRSHSILPLTQLTISRLQLQAPQIHQQQIPTGRSERSPQKSSPHALRHSSFASSSFPSSIPSHHRWRPLHPPPSQCPRNPRDSPACPPRPIRSLHLSPVLHACHFEPWKPLRRPMTCVVHHGTSSPRELSSRSPLLQLLPLVLPPSLGTPSSG